MSPQNSWNQHNHERDKGIRTNQRRTEYTKTALQIAKNGDPEKGKAKEQARTKKANKWTDLSSANCSEDNPPRKELDGKWLR